ncbi:hypothetical protein ACFL20_11185 [Spirochaetota bacterium]
MTDKNDIRRVERHAKSLLMSKDITPAKLEIVREIMDNDRIKPLERYRAIIDLIINCPDKHVDIPETGKINIKENEPKNELSLVENETAAHNKITNEPTETSLYINDLHQKYNHLKIFKRRYFVHRNNRFGIGFRKRLIPSKRLIKILSDISDFQEKLLLRLSSIMMGFLRDEETDDPTIFNYIRLLRKWLVQIPLVKYDYNVIKWMERHIFEREFKGYVVNYLSFLMLQLETREKILLQIEDWLRENELKKEEVNDDDSDPVRREKEKKNMAREKQIYRYMILTRAFLSKEEIEENPISRKLKINYNINSLQELVHIVMEALVFQRAVKPEQVISYFQIEAPKVSNTAWDYSESMLKEYGKDMESKRRKKLEALKKDLLYYETQNMILNINYEGQNILMRAAGEQWKIMDRKKQDPKIVYEENFFNFLDGLVNYFNNAIIPILNGSTIDFIDTRQKEHQGAIFSPAYFEKKQNQFTTILDEMHHFRTNNPTLAISKSEVNKIVRGQITSMSHVERFVKIIGDFFYKLGKDLHGIFELHKVWSLNSGNTGKTETVNSTLSQTEIEIGKKDPGMPIPYHNCIIEKIHEGNPLTKNFTGKIILDESLREGIFLYIIGFSYQTAFECQNEHILTDIRKRKQLLEKTKEISPK